MNLQQSTRCRSALAATAEELQLELGTLRLIKEQPPMKTCDQVLCLLSLGVVGTVNADPPTGVTPTLLGRGRDA